MSAAWEVVIGLEIHTQLATRSKIFSGASTAYGAEPNTQACLIDLGYPGMLPVLTPPAILAGEPPINIHNMMMSCVASLS